MGSFQVVETAIERTNGKKADNHNPSQESGVRSQEQGTPAPKNDLSISAFPFCYSPNSSTPTLRWLLAPELASRILLS
jgi:hypothetical protein